MRKVAAFCLVAMVALSLLPATALAKTEYTGKVDPYAVMLLDADTQQILYEKNSDEQIEPASTCKILTCILALENSKPTDIVEVSENAAGLVSSPLKLVTHEKLAMKDLLAGMMMASSNDASIAIAEHVGGSVSGFVDRMNAKAQELGMTKTHFETPHGLHVDNAINTSTARDMAKLTLYALKNPKFVEIVNRASYDMPADNKKPARTMENTNQLMLPNDPNYYSNATGIKTGSTPAAAGCLISSASKDGMNLICLVFKDETADRSVRWPLTKSLFEWGFQKFEKVDLSKLLDNVEPVQKQVADAAVKDSKSGLLEFAKPEVGGTYVTIGKEVLEGIQNGTDSIITETTYSKDPVKAPVSKGDVLGTVTYKSKNTGDVIYTGNLIAPRDVAELGSEPGASGGTAVTEMPSISPGNVVTDRDNHSVWLWVLFPAVLIAGLVIRLVTANRSKRRRFRRRQPHYSYKIKK